MSKSKKVNIDEHINFIIKEVNSYLPNFDKEKFTKVVKFAHKAHEGQLRKDGETAYISHPLEAAKILTKLHVDEDTLIAAILHDVPEDTEYSLRDVEKKFGKKISFLVNGITKLSKVYYRHDMAERQIESLKKLLIHSAKDPRVILIKLADRLHNMRTLEHVKPEKRVRIAKETMEIYVPIANLLGIDEIKKQLEDICFMHLFPKDYEKIEQTLKETKIRQRNILEETVNIIEKELKKEKSKDYEIYGREKSRYSTFKKSIRKDKAPEDLEDLLAIRIIVNDIKECYLVLGIIHSLFKPKPGRFKDYIAVPKSNGYQSLHTVVFGLRGQTTEFQIRTHQMHLDAQYGIAAHYFYKDSDDNGEYQAKQSKWAQQILEYQKANYDSENFLEALKIDIFQDRIFTFTPKGDTVDLPRGATAIDFAYSIHTEVGDNALKAEVNGQIIPLTIGLRTGDVVNIVTANQPKGPNREWLIFAKTNLAKNKIREALRKNSRRKKLSIGRRLLQKEFDRAGAGLIEEIAKKKLKNVVKKYRGIHHCRTFEDVLVRIGEGSINPVDVLSILFPVQALVNERKGNFLNKLFKINKYNTKKRVAIKIKAIDRIGAGRDLLAILSDNKVNVINLSVNPRRFKNIFAMTIDMEVDSFEQFSYICEQMEQIDEIIECSRSFHGKRMPFFVLSFFTIAMWIAHPFVTYFVVTNNTSLLPRSIVLYGGIALLFILVFLLKRTTQRTFPELRDNSGRILWIMTFIIGNIALAMILAEIYFYKLHFNWVLVIGLVLFLYAYLVTEYLAFKNQIQ
ncbi:RelA/SpoT family protein [Patescibacteria group bacterium]